MLMSHPKLAALRYAAIGLAEEYELTLQLLLERELPGFYAGGPNKRIVIA